MKKGNDIPLWVIILYFCGPILENRFMKRCFIILLLLIAPLCLLAQVPVSRSTEIVKIGSTEYYMHHVEAGQTLYSISKTYNVSIEEITRLNPEVADGLQAEMVIGIPVVSEQKPEVEPVEPKHEEPSPQVVPQEPQVAPQEPQVIPQEPQVVPKEQIVVGGTYVVKNGEDLYDIAKRFGIDVADFKAVNSGLDNYPTAGTVINVPAIVNEDDYIIHKVEEQERTSSLMKRWKVSEDEFREKNISVGSRVFVGQIVLIPIEPIVSELQPIIADETDEPDELEEPIIEEEIPIVEEPQIVIEELEPVTDCPIDSAYASARYRVALLVPLYLDEVASINVTKENIAQAEKSRPFSFLPFYEGFMLAADSLVNTQGLRLDLTVIDVTDKVATANAAVTQLEKSDYDLIIGPFFSKSFAVVAAYAKEKNITLVNPLSTRESILEGYPNVVKIKPNLFGQINEVANLVKNQYRDANVFIISQEKAADTVYLNALERQLNMAINEDVVVGNDAILQYAKDESERMEMGKRIVSTITMEGQVYSTKDLQNEMNGKVMINNTINRYPYSELNTMLSKLSGVRTNFVVAYGDNNVFATQVLNGLKKSVSSYPITLVALPEWDKFEKLSVETLLQMNAIYMDAGFVDYSDDAVSRFVVKFRKKYGCEPLDYAFEGFDVAWYFLNALMRYGSEMKDCLPSCNMPLMRSNYRFANPKADYGLENQSWRMYQYDSQSIELELIDPYQTNTMFEE